MKREQVITNIKGKKGLPKRVTIFLENDSSFDISVDIFLTSKLNVGQKLEEDEVHELIREDHFFQAKGYALDALFRKARSKAGLLKILQNKGISQDISEEVLAQLELDGLVDDNKFLRDWIDLRMRTKPMGKVKLRQELLGKGIDKTLIDHELQNISRDEELEVALELAEKKLRSEVGFEDEGVKRRLFGFLQRRGFTQDIIMNVFRRIEEDSEYQT